MTAAMFIFGVLTVICAGGVVFSSKPLNSALWLVVTLFLMAVHYALLNALFVATVQILVYAGAIMVLVIFVIMLLGPDAQLTEPRSNVQLAFGSLFAALFVMTLATAITAGIREGEFRAAPNVVDGSTAGVGDTLFSKFIFPFELTSLLILAAIIGSVFLGYERKRALKPGRGLSAVQKQVEENA